MATVTERQQAGMVAGAGSWQITFSPPPRKWEDERERKNRKLVRLQNHKTHPSDILTPGRIYLLKVS